MDRKIVIFLLTAGCLLMSALCVHAGNGTSGAAILGRLVSVRGYGMGEAYTANLNDPCGIYYNPASCGFVEGQRISLLYNKGFINDTLASVSAVFPSFETGSLAASLFYYNAGDIELISSAGTVREVNAETDVIAAASYALMVGPVTCGLNLKYLYSNFLNTVKGNALVYDVGAGMYVADNVVVGAAIQNIGSEFKYLSTGDGLPLIIRGGITWETLPQKLVVAADILRNPGDAVALHMGSEYLLSPQVALRAGCKLGYSSLRYTLGMGLVINNLSFDYAWTPISELGNSHTVSIGMRMP